MVHSNEELANFKTRLRRLTDLAAAISSPALSVLHLTFVQQPGTCAAHPKGVLAVVACQESVEVTCGPVQSGTLGGSPRQSFADLRISWNLKPKNNPTTMQQQCFWYVILSEA